MSTTACFCLLSAAGPAWWSRGHHTSIPSSTPRCSLFVRSSCPRCFSLLSSVSRGALPHSTLAHTFHSFGSDTRCPVSHCHFILFLFSCVQGRKRRVLHLKDLTCASASVTIEGTLKHFNAPSARKLKTYQHVESFQRQLLHKEAILLLHFCCSRKPRHVWNTTLISKRHKVYTQQQNLKGRIPTGPLSPPRPATLPSHLLLPLTTSLLCCHGPSTVRGEHSCRDSWLLGRHHPTTRPHSFSGTACPGPCGSLVPPLPTPNAAEKERSCHQDTWQRIIAHVAFTRGGSKTYLNHPTKFRLHSPTLDSLGSPFSILAPSSGT